MPCGFVQFDTADQWRAFVAGLGLDPLIPQIVRAKYARAQKLYLLGWIDLDLVKAGELVALTALELAVRDRYGGARSGKRKDFALLLRHMVEVDG